MKMTRSALSALLAGAFAMAFAPHVSAATRPASLADIVQCEPEIVAGEVLGARSRTSEDGSLLTDVRVGLRKVWRGELQGPETTITLPDPASHKGGARLTAGHVYVLVLDDAGLPGAPGARTIHPGGVFEIVGTTDGPRAVQQTDSRLAARDAVGGAQGLTLDALSQAIQDLPEDPCNPPPPPPPPPPSCIPDGQADDTLYQTYCCSGYAVNGSTVCWNPSDYGNSWASCYHVCGTAPVNGCIPSGGIDDTLYSTNCCSGVAVNGSTQCLNPADYGTTWASCVQTCA